MSTKAELIELGRKEAREGRYRSAIDYFEQAIHKDPKDPDLFFYLGGAHYKQGDLKASRKALNEALKRDLHHAKARALLAKVEGREQGERESQLPRLLGGIAFALVLAALGVAFILALLHLETLKTGYGQLLDNIYHSMDIEDIITGSWQPWRIVTTVLMLVFVLGTFATLAVLIAYLVCCPVYAIRNNLWRFDIEAIRQLGTGASALVLALILLWAGLLIYVLAQIWGAKVWIVVAIVGLLGINQLFTLGEQRKRREKPRADC